MKTTSDILKKAKSELNKLDQHLLDVIEVREPDSLDYGVYLAKIISKLSPLIGNLIEFSVVNLLNEHDWDSYGNWIRQDPGFPDALFKSKLITPNPGIEIKAWFPLATEITARFKDSVNIFQADNIDLALIAWLPEHIIWGKPKIIDVIVVSGKSAAIARDKHYNRPPFYVIFEPEDTAARTSNLQQTNTNGYKLQEDKCDVSEAVKMSNSLGLTINDYSPDPEYQAKLRSLYNNFVYRLDTNYAKLDRIEHEEIEHFKNKVMLTMVHGKTIHEWAKLLASKDHDVVEGAVLELLNNDSTLSAE